MGTKYRPRQALDLRGRSPLSTIPVPPPPTDPTPLYLFWGLRIPLPRIIGNFVRTSIGSGTSYPLLSSSIPRRMGVVERSRIFYWHRISTVGDFRVEGRSVRDQVVLSGSVRPPTSTEKGRGGGRKQGVYSVVVKLVNVPSGAFRSVPSPLHPGISRLLRQGRQKSGTRGVFSYF